MHKFCYRLVSLFTLCSLTFLQAQELPEIIPPSPTVANLMQFEEVPVSYYTGQPNISIPLYSKAINGDLAVNIGLSYNTQGIKVNNRSGWTGTGWSLMAGGSISRTVRDVPDELLKNSYGYTGVKTGVLHLDSYWDYDGLNPADKREYDYKAVGSSQNKYDNDVDLYQFNFLGASGRFVILRDGSGGEEVKLISKSQALRIEPLFAGDGSKSITSFTITDPNGYVFEFSEVETTTSEVYTGSVPQGGQGTLSTSGTNEFIPVNSAWHLTTVKTSNDIVLATFTYASHYENYTASVTRTYNRITELFGSTNVAYADITQACNQARLKPEQILSQYETQANTRKISTITFKDGTSLEFLTDQSQNHPETNGAILKTLNIKDKTGAINKTYSFVYETTSGTNTIVNTYRLWLMKVIETAGGINHDYILDYNNKEDLPGFDSHLSDDWGYYSDIGMTTTICNSPNVYDDSTITTGLLSSITYPTDGKKEFEFEHHTYSYIGNQTLDYDAYMKNPRNNEADIKTATINYTNGTDPIPFNVMTIDLDFAQDIYISSDISSQNAIEHRLIVTDSNNNTVFVDLNEDCYFIPNLPAGITTISFDYAQNLIPDPYTIQGDVEVDYAKEPTSTPLREEMIGGGVRIKSIAFKDDVVNSPNPSKKINYVYEDRDNHIKSSGVVDAEEDRLERNYNHTAHHRLWAPPNYTGLGSSLVKYYVTEKGVRAQLSQGEYVGYRHVKVFETGNGYTTYNYTSAYEFPSPSNVFDLPNPHPAPNLDYKRGLLRKKKVFNEAGDILQEVSHLSADGTTLMYDLTPVESLFTMRSSFKSDNCKWFVYYDSYSDYSSGYIDTQLLTSCDPSPSIYNYPTCNLNDISQSSTVFESGWVRPTQVITKDYFYEGTLQTVKEVRETYSYNTINFQLSEKNSYYDRSGTEEHLQTKYYYPVGGHLNATPSNVVNKMVILNMVNTVLDEETFRNTSKTSETNTIYYEPHMDLIVPEMIKVGKGSQSPQERISFHEYDNHGNLLQVSKTDDGPDISYIWGQNQTVPIAQLTNATYNSIESVLGNGFNITGNLSSGDENSLRTSSLFSNALITVFEYDAMLNVIKTTDEKSYEMNYEYDAFNRLESIKDHNGKILSKNVYHYKNQY